MHFWVYVRQNLYDLEGAHFLQIFYEQTMDVIH